MTMRPDHYDQLAPTSKKVSAISQESRNNVERRLYEWADWMRIEASTTRGYPSKSIGAPDANIHSVEDLEEVEDLRVVRAVNACVYSLPVLERNAVLAHYGLMKSDVWRVRVAVQQGKANEEKMVGLQEATALFDQAVVALYPLLRSRISV
jgi:hypothetical protein